MDNKNVKQTVPLLVALAPLAPFIPPLLIGGVIICGIAWLLSDDKTKTKPETLPASPEAERPKLLPIASATVARAPVASTQPAVTIAPKPRAPVSVLLVHKPAVSAAPPARVSVPLPVIQPAKPVVQTPPPPIKKKFVTREDLATIFQHGARALNRTTAVDALKKLGFGKTAAYSALSTGGRFAFWLQFAPDGIITLRK